MSVKPFEYKLGSGDTDGIVFARTHAQSGCLFDEPLDGLELIQSVGGRHASLNFERATEVEVLHNTAHIHAVVIIAEDSGDGEADQLAGDDLRSFEFTLIFQFEFAGDGSQGA